jgi:hypothetical protein
VFHVHKVIVKIFKTLARYSGKYPWVGNTVILNSKKATRSYFFFIIDEELITAVHNFQRKLNSFVENIDFRNLLLCSTIHFYPCFNEYTETSHFLVYKAKSRV